MLHHAPFYTLKCFCTLRIRNYYENVTMCVKKLCGRGGGIWASATLQSQSQYSGSNRNVAALKIKNYVNEISSSRLVLSDMIHRLSS